MRVDPGAGGAEWRDGLAQDWGSLLAQCLPEGLWVPLPNRGRETVDLAQALQLDALILTGGNDLGDRPERDETERKLLDWALASEVRVLGVCRGLQLMVDYFGGRLTRREGHVAVTHDVAVRAEELGLTVGVHEVNSYHAWAVEPEALPEALRPWACDADGWVEAVRGPGRSWGIMWHPERPLPSRDPGPSLIRSWLAAS